MKILLLSVLVVAVIGVMVPSVFAEDIAPPPKLIKELHFDLVDRGDMYADAKIIRMSEDYIVFELAFKISNPNEHSIVLDSFEYDIIEKINIDCDEFLYNEDKSVEFDCDWTEIKIGEYRTPHDEWFTVLPERPIIIKTEFTLYSDYRMPEDWYTHYSNAVNNDTLPWVVIGNLYYHYSYLGHADPALLLKDTFEFEVSNTTPNEIVAWEVCGEGTILKDGICVALCGEGTIFEDGKCVVEKNGGGCLIATAAFGSEMAPQVQFLRELRDNTVMNTQSGTAFMTGFNQFYYSFSPAVADLERENPVFKEAVKVTLTPLLTSLTLLNYVEIDSEEEMLGYGIGIILLNVGMYFVAPAVLIIALKNRLKN